MYIYVIANGGPSFSSQNDKHDIKYFPTLNLENNENFF